MEYSLSVDILFINEALGITTSELAEQIGTTPETLSRIVNNKMPASKKILEDLYSFAYKKGLNINLSKAQYYSKKTDIVLFHGSKDKIQGELSLEYSKSKVDLGPGFYTGDNYNQSLDFISLSDDGAVYIFEYDKSDLKVLNLDVSLSWMLLILYNRGLIEKYKNTDLYKRIESLTKGYDVIIAPIADNRMFSTIDDFLNFQATTEQASHALNALSLGKQIVFKTEKGLKHLKMLEMLYVSKPEKENSLKRKLEIINNSERYVTEAYKKYIRKGLYINEVFGQ